MEFLEDQHLFWDVDIKNLDSEGHAQAIIERVLERGSWNNIEQIISHYGRNRIIEASKHAAWFSDKTMYFVSGYFSIPLTEMRCYVKRQSNPIPYL